MSFSNYKKIIAYSLPVLFLLMLVGLPLFAQAALPDNQIVPKACDKPQNCGWPQLIQLVNNVITFLLFYIAAPLAVLSFAWAGFLYITAAGDTGKISKAHDIFRKVFIGMILAFGAWVIVKLLITGLGVKPEYYNEILDS